ncbi:MAG: sugar-phosphate isomerase, RpiB/LacA/LacB family [Myxococcales bacterium]|nr:sugar-phosphate isomerase, RpiB/LacA/LacB family [Myxococcales bacterium]
MNGPVTKIFAGSDHAGFALRGVVVAHLRARGLEVLDLGAPSAESTDYPDWGAKVGRAVRDAPGSVGVLICGTGMGICIAANKVSGVRGTAVWSVESARLAKAHNDANVLCLGARLTSDAEAVLLVDTWLDTTFEGGRHQRRLDKVAALEREAAATSSSETKGG